MSDKPKVESIHAATGLNDGIEFRWLHVSTGCCASIFINDAQCELLDQIYVIMNAMTEELELESGDLRAIDDPSWQLFREIAVTWTNSRERTNAEEDEVALSRYNLLGGDTKEVLTNANAKV